MALARPWATSFFQHAEHLDPSNTEQAKAWDGDEGAYWADNAEHFDRAVAGYHVPFMAVANISAQDQVLDVGCGTGQTTRDAARAATSGSALGLDLSVRMIDYARQVAAPGRPGQREVRAGRRSDPPFMAEEFDVAISRTGAMFFGDPVAAFTNIAGALRRGGRLVLLSWQGLDGNEWIRELSTAMAAGRDLPTPPADAPGPFSLADPERVWAVLGLLGWMLDGLDDEGRRRAVDNLRATLTAHDTGHGVFYGSATWTIQATRP